MKYAFALLGVALLTYVVFFATAPSVDTQAVPNTAIIDVAKILSGGPPKDGIPALTNPQFVRASEATFVKDEHLGVVVEHSGDARFYPYAVMVWHEVVNDTVGGKPLVVTFCPLCASVAVFEAMVGGEVLEFGVSGKLYESNLLMYDRKTDSYWSQILGQGVVGQYAGTQLTYYPSAVMSVTEARERYPSLKVLSTNTGHQRDYTVYPYGDYDTNETFYFPVSQTDTRLPAKEIMYAALVRGVPVAFVRADVLKNKDASIETSAGIVRARADGSEIIITDSDGVEVPGFYAMWFSWAVHNVEKGVIWSKK